MAKANTTTRTTTRAAEATATGNPLAHYTAQLKAWPVKYAGNKPTADNFKVAHMLGARPGTKTAVAIAMMLRDSGATQPQVINLNGGAYLNKARELVAAGHAQRVPMPATAEGHTVYKLALPVAKAKAKAPRKAKADKGNKPAPADKPATA